MQRSKNVALGRVLFQGISEYGFMHSSPFIIRALMKMIELGELCAIEYFAKSLKEVDHCFHDNAQPKMLKSIINEYGGVEYGVIRTPVWCEEN